jgi:ketosteroid isomerase-like protein
MRTLMMLAAAMAAGVATPVLAAGAAGPMAVINQYNNALNKGDGAASAKLCAPGGAIIDDFAPHIWQGQNFCADWWAAAGTWFSKNGITDNVVTIHKPWHVGVTGDRAYVVAPVTLTFKQHGKPMTESGSILTAALQKVGSDWRIKGWSWAQH